jgi:hypothetical protein
MAGVSQYTQETADLICDLIVEGKSIRQICSLDDMPASSTIFKWLSVFPAFAEQYTRAKREQAERLADELIELADDDSKDISGELSMPNGVAVQRSRLMVDTRKWYLSKVLPKVYGDKILNEHTGKDGGAMEFVVKSILEEK